MFGSMVPRMAKVLGISEGLIWLCSVLLDTPPAFSVRCGRALRVGTKRLTRGPRQGLTGGGDWA
jgi:hypothetical protein